MKAAVYLMVSNEEEWPLEEQVLFAQKYCELYGYEVVSWYLETKRFKNHRLLNQRPRGKKLWSDAMQGQFEIVLTLSLEQLGYQISDLLRVWDYFQNYDIEIRAMTDQIDDATLIFLHESFAQIQTFLEHYGNPTTSE